MRYTMINIMNDVIEELELNSKSILDIDWHNWYQTYLDISKFTEEDEESLDETLKYFMKLKNFSKCFIKHLDTYNNCYIFLNDLTEYEFYKFNNNFSEKDKYIILYNE